MCVFSSELLTVNEGWRGGEEEQGAKINHLPSGQRVQLSLGDRQQIRGDVQEHL